MDSIQGKCSRLMKKGNERLEKDKGKSKENRLWDLRELGSAGKKKSSVLGAKGKKTIETGNNIGNVLKIRLERVS